MPVLGLLRRFRSNRTRGLHPPLNVKSCERVYKELFMKFLADNGLLAFELLEVKVGSNGRIDSIAFVEEGHSVYRINRPFPVDFHVYSKRPNGIDINNIIKIDNSNDIGIHSGSYINVELSNAPDDIPFSSVDVRGIRLYGGIEPYRELFESGRAQNISSVRIAFVRYDNDIYLAMSAIYERSNNIVAYYPHLILLRKELGDNLAENLYKLFNLNFIEKRGIVKVTHNSSAIGQGCGLEYYLILYVTIRRKHDKRLRRYFVRSAPPKVEALSRILEHLDLDNVGREWLSEIVNNVALYCSGSSIVDISVSEPELWNLRRRRSWSKRLDNARKLALSVCKTFGNSYECCENVLRDIDRHSLRVDDPLVALSNILRAHGCKNRARLSMRP